MKLQEPIPSISPFHQRKLLSSKSIGDLSVYDDYYSWSGCHGETPEYQIGDLRKVSHLGEGAFSKVSLVITGSRDQLAMKSLDPSKLTTQNDFVDAAVDLARESNILSKLDHENIIRLRGVPSTNLSESFAASDFGRSDAGYFILLDIIEETLESRLSRWRRDLRRAASRKGKVKFMKRALSLNTWKKKIDGCSKVDDVMMKDRMRTAAIGVARGMKYLHDEGIIMQDLSISNIGFHQETGEVKIFDFGMAHNVNEEVHALPAKRNGKGLVCGTPRYMAPEVMKGEGGNKASDVFAFGVILYEICTLVSFFVADISLQGFEQRVLSGERPPLDKSIPCIATSNLISRGWATDPEDRPTFDEVVGILVDILTVDDSVVQENKSLW